MLRSFFKKEVIISDPANKLEWFLFIYLLSASCGGHRFTLLWDDPPLEQENG